MSSDPASGSWGEPHGMGNMNILYVPAAFSPLSFSWGSRSEKEEAVLLLEAIIYFIWCLFPGFALPKPFLFVRAQLCLSVPISVPIARPQANSPGDPSLD